MLVFLYKNLILAEYLILQEIDCLQCFSELIFIVTVTENAASDKYVAQCSRSMSRKYISCQKLLEIVS